MAESFGQVQTLSQNQTLSPQMQQSLHVLQAPIMELRQLVAQELAINPVLEEEYPSPRQEDATPEVSERDELWDTYHVQQTLGREETLRARERHQWLLDSRPAAESMLDQIAPQLAFIDLKGVERRVALAVVGNLDDSGYLGMPVEEIAADFQLTPLQVEDVLQKVQSRLDPPGLAARDLRECLLLQLQRNGQSDSLAAKIVSTHLQELGRKQVAAITKALGHSPTAVQDAVQLIASLDPHPGRIFRQETSEIVTPEVVVERTADGFEVRLNKDELPSLRISTAYKDMLGAAAGGENGREVRNYLREKIRSGRFFLRTLEQRSETILHIAESIVQHQPGFFEEGPSHLKPMTMAMVAEAVGVHETTVSRAVSGKYMETPWGIFEMKYFFTSGYQTEGGDEVSNESVRQSITELIDGEPAHKPLSDQQIVKILTGRGLTVARRTIAKYREQLGILPSHLRKRL